MSPRRSHSTRPCSPSSTREIRWRPTCAASWAPPGRRAVGSAVRALEFRDPARGRALARTLARLTQEIGRNPVSVMHVCGSHEQAIARFGLRAAFPPALDVIMGPGCPVCITDVPEVDEGVALARQRVRLATYGDMRRCPGSAESQADAL